MLKVRIVVYFQAGQRKGREVLFEKGHKGPSLETENILHLDLGSVYTFYLYVKIHPAIYLRFAYFTVYYTSVKLFFKYLCIYAYS